MAGLKDSEVIAHRVATPYGLGRNLQLRPQLAVTRQDYAYVVA